MPPYALDEKYSRQSGPAIFFKSRRIISILAIIAVAALALGLGLGLGLRRTEASHASSIATDPSSVAVPTPTPTPTFLSRGILNDTSLATVITSDDNPHVFFQDYTGSLRHTVFSKSTNSWLDDIDYVNTPKAPRVHTPIAASGTQVELVVDGFDVELTYVFYIDVNNLLSVASYSASDGDLGGFAAPAINSTFVTEPGSRSLSIIMTKFFWK